MVSGSLAPRGSEPPLKKPAAAAHAERRASSSAASSRRATFPLTRYLFFGGKGGVGKTTVAASTALYLLERAHASDERILLFSTDPAHSLSDSLNMKVGDRLAEVARRSHGGASLFAYEMDARAALEKFKTEHRAVIQEIAERGTLLDESDINEFLNLSLPGMDEVMALFELSEIDRAGDFSHIVVDTAPSGHTSRLLRLPETFAYMVRALDLMAEKHRYIVAQFARGRNPGAVDSVDLFLSDLTERIERVRAMLYDTGRTSFTLVIIPEAMSVEETARYYERLLQEKIPVTDMVVNRIEREHGHCEYCHARVESQRAWLEEIRRKFKALRQHTVPLMPEEIRGLAGLRRFARLVWEKESDAGPPGRPNAGKERDAAASRRGDRDKKGALSAASTRLNVAASAQAKSSTRFSLESRRLLIFGGKGGVGKTTAASAAALALAESESQARVLIFSTDPAHSLSDSFDEPVGEMRKGIAGLKNLDAMEIDPAARFEELKARYRAWTDELFASLTGGSRWEIQFDREAMRELVSLAPPGIDEIAALSAISDLLDQSVYTTIVLDTAPTGHLLRFLELPAIVLSWVRAFLKLLLKYREVVRASGVAEELIALSKGIKRVSALLTDARQCEFIGVAIPERMSLEETMRLVESLGRLRTPMQRLLINGIMPKEADTACDFCAARRRAGQSVLGEFRRKLGPSLDLFIAPQQPHEIQGSERLREHFAGWRPFADF